jgi:hypothetical protein
MTMPNIRWGCKSLCLTWFSLSLLSPASDLPKQASRTDLCVTEGKIETLSSGWLAVEVPKMRAYLNQQTLESVQVRFKYLGSTGAEASLGSGELRRQLGLKLRAQDACNLVYVMWRIKPEPKLVVSVKTNPGEHTSGQCGNRGYHNTKPRRAQQVPPLQVGAIHTLRAELRGVEMTVLADNRLVWEGSVGNEVLDFDGPVGIRSDNARWEFELRSGSTSKSGSGRTGCTIQDSD